MDWSEIALPVGSPESRELGLHLNFTLPCATCDEPATERQAEAVKIFYQTDFGEWRDSQAHALLSCREYARLCAKAIFKEYAPDVQLILARALAAFLLSDDSAVAFVTNWRDAAFKRGSSSPRVRNSQYFHDVEVFASYLEGMLELSGWTTDHLKNFGF